MSLRQKKACEEYTRAKIKKLGCCIIDKNHIDYTFFENLLKNHNECIEKVGVGLIIFISFLGS